MPTSERHKRIPPFEGDLDVGKIVVCTMLSIDGYTEGSGADVMAMPMDEAFGWHNVERARAASSFLFGANPRAASIATIRIHKERDGTERLAPSPRRQPERSRTDDTRTKGSTR
jgi:hypothetical protein